MDLILKLYNPQRLLCLWQSAAVLLCHQSSFIQRVHTGIFPWGDLLMGALSDAAKPAVWML